MPKKVKDKSTVIEADDFDIEQPKILFLRGAFLRDSSKVDDAFYDSLENKSELIKNKPTHITYNKFPRRFFDRDTWVQKTNVLCWNCSNEITKVPIPVPNNNQLVGKNETFGVDAICCSFPCASLYISDHCNNKWERHQMLIKLLKIMHPENKISDIKSIPHAPSRFELEQYGNGHMTKDEYNEHNNMLMEALICGESSKL